MHVKEGQLVAVVGSVGSGMEFFISGWKIIFLNSTTKWLNRWTNPNVWRRWFSIFFFDEKYVVLNSIKQQKSGLL